MKVNFFITRKEKGMGLILVILITLVLFILVLTAISLISTDRMINTNQSRMMQAFYLAEAGVQDAYYRLVYNNLGDSIGSSGSYTFTNGTMDLNGIGTYQVTISKAADRASTFHILSRGFAGKTQKTIETEITAPTPVWAQYIMYAQSDISIGGNSATIEGPIFTGGDVDCNKNMKDKLEIHKGTPQTNIIDITKLISQADATAKNSVDVGAWPANVGIVYATGGSSVRISGQLDHNLIVVTNGDCTVDVSKKNATEYSLAVISQGDLEIKKADGIKAFFYAGGVILGKGSNTDLKGVLIGNSMDFRGKVSLIYDPQVIPTEWGGILGGAWTIESWHDKYGIYQGGT